MFCLNYSQTSLLSAFPSSSRVWQNSLARLYRRHKNSLSLLCSEMSDEVFFRNQWMQVGNSTPGHYLLLQKPERGIDPKQSLLLRKVNLLPAVPELVAAKGNKSWQLRVNNRIKMQVGETNILKTSLVILSGELLSAAWLKLDSKLTCSKNRCRKPIFVQLGFRGWCKSSSWWNCFHRNQSWQMSSLLYYASFCSVFMCGTYYLVKLTVLHSVLRFVCLCRKVLAPPTREISTLMAYAGRSTLLHLVCLWPQVGKQAVAGGAASARVPLSQGPPHQHGGWDRNHSWLKQGLAAQASRAAVSSGFFPERKSIHSPPGVSSLI